MMNATDATSINSQNAFNTLLKNFAQITIKLNIKMNKIKKTLSVKRKEFIENNIMNDNDKIF